MAIVKRVMLIIGILLTIIYVSMGSIYGYKNAYHVLMGGFAPIINSDIELINDTKNISCKSNLSLPLKLDYDGILKLKINVKRGNNLDIYLIPYDMKQDINITRFNMSKEYRLAKKTRIFSTTKKLKKGYYFLLLSDKTLGWISSKSTDVYCYAKLTSL